MPDRAQCRFVVVICPANIGKRSTVPVSQPDAPVTLQDHGGSSQKTPRRNAGFSAAKPPPSFDPDALPGDPPDARRRDSEPARRSIAPPMPLDERRHVGNAPPMRTTFILLVAGAVSGTIVGCSVLSGLDQFEMTGATVSGSGGYGDSGGAGSTTVGVGAGGGGGQACAPNEECVPAVANAIYVTLTELCGPGTTRLSDMLDCSQCTCQPQCLLDGYYYNDQNSCINGVNANIVSQSTCSNIIDTTTPFYINATTAPRCATAPPADFAVSVCKLDTVASCSSDAVCLPKGQAVCALLDGSNVTCPPGFDNPRTIFQGINSDYADVDCGCECTAGGSCQQQASVSDEDACGGNSVAIPTSGACEEISSAAIPTGRAIQTPSAESVTCETTINPIATPRTLCCSP